MVTKKLKTQILNALIHIIESLVIFALCAYCSIGVYYNGAGTRGKNYGLKRIFADWIYKMEDQGNDTLVKIILLTMFAAAAAAGLIVLIYYLLHLPPGMTKLGRSIRKQAASYERLSELIELIDTDLERESQIFGSELRISSQWMVGEEAMRLNRVQQISVNETWKEHKFIVTDKDFNKMEVSFASKDDLENSVRFLRKKLPDIPVEGILEGFAPTQTTLFTPSSPNTINAATADNYITGSASTASASIGSTTTGSTTTGSASTGSASASSASTGSTTTGSASTACASTNSISARNTSTSNTPAIPLTQEAEQTRALAFAAHYEWSILNTIKNLAPNPHLRKNKPKCRKH